MFRRTARVSSPGRQTTGRSYGYGRPRRCSGRHYHRRPRNPRLFVRAFRKPFGCVMEVQKGSLGGKEVLPYMQESRKIETLITAAHDREVDDPVGAISMYREVVDRIVALDRLGSVAAAWRRPRYPINRLSLLLERTGRSGEAYQEILRYDQYHDVFGLTQGDEKSVASRKQRLSKKFADSGTLRSDRK